MLLFILYITSLVFLISYTAVRTTIPASADAIIVLGASQWGGTPSPVFKARLDWAKHLYQQNYAPLIITTGGVGEGESISEALVGKRYLVDQGIRPENILSENNGKTSWQSLSAVSRLYQSEGVSSIILVSDSFHMLRLHKMAQDLGFIAFTSPAPNSPITANKALELRYVFREAVVFTAYLIWRV